ncbi:MAG: aldose 1-epimerase family protein [Oscillospiraceae bacterium]|nr:aldose 1-epimerase family protein [Oscillospiraceae bacterium]
MSVSVKTKGAELTSVYSKDAEFEYLWQGDPDIWYGQAPILFPIVGRLLDDKYRLGGAEYTMPKHGLARKREFELVSKSDNSLVFEWTHDDETLQAYPYKFRLIVTYLLSGKKLSVKHEVVNENDGYMYFSLGAHPGFNCEMGDYIEFDEPETLETEKIDLVEALRIKDKAPVLSNSKNIIITEDIFNEDALILSGYKSKNVTLKSENHGRAVNFSLGDAPYLGIWAKPGAPYVCIEPWYGVNDDFEKKDDFSEKYQIQTLAKGETFEFTWSADIIDAEFPD